MSPANYTNHPCPSLLSLLLKVFKVFKVIKDNNANLLSYSIHSCLPLLLSPYSLYSLLHHLSFNFL